jgi:hypothetical protein
MEERWILKAQGKKPLYIPRLATQLMSSVTAIHLPCTLTAPCDNVRNPLF